jgi:hypothetical protein
MTDPLLHLAPKIVCDAVQAADYSAIDQKVIRKMDNKDFAKWQADHSDSLHHQIFANQEWSRRLMTEELKSHRQSAWIGVFGSLAGTILGVLLSNLDKILGQ